jgi:hypothetical protein
MMIAIQEKELSVEDIANIKKFVVEHKKYEEYLSDLKKRIQSIKNSFNLTHVTFLDDDMYYQGIVNRHEDRQFRGELLVSLKAMLARFEERMRQLELQIGKSDPFPEAEEEDNPLLAEGEE